MIGKIGINKGGRGAKREPLAVVLAFATELGNSSG
jgi:hypothetical protein